MILILIDSLYVFFVIFVCIWNLFINETWSFNYEEEIFFIHIILTIFE
jgi:hypothetical protein